MNALIETDKTYGLPVSGMAPGLALMFNEPLYERCKQIAQIMSRANGVTPGHLIGQSEACFAVVTRSITWKLDPFSVAQATYQTPGGKVGYEGKLVQAILENSGHIEGGVKFTLIGDWDRIRGKWLKKSSDRGKEYVVPNWKEEDENGLGVVVSAQVKGEKEPRELTVWMRECFPRNSTLWALRPSQQICYTAVRAFANVAAPGLFMGVPFSSDLEEQTMIDVTPVSDRPQRSAPPERTQTEPAPEPVREQEELQKEANEGEEGEIEEPREPSPADAYELGYQARDKGRPRRVPPEIDNQGAAFSDAWIGGWEARDTEMADAHKKKG